MNDIDDAQPQLKKSRWTIRRNNLLLADEEVEELSTRIGIEEQLSGNILPDSFSRTAKSNEPVRLLRFSLKGRLIVVFMVQVGSPEACLAVDHIIPLTVPIEYCMAETRFVNDFLSNNSVMQINEAYEDDSKVDSRGQQLDNLVWSSNTNVELLEDQDWGMDIIIPEDDPLNCGLDSVNEEVYSQKLFVRTLSITVIPLSF